MAIYKHQVCNSYDGSESSHLDDITRFIQFSPFILHTGFIPWIYSLDLYTDCNDNIGGDTGGGNQAIAESVAVIATQVEEEEQAVPTAPMTIEELREQNRARCIGLAMMLLGRGCVLLSLCEVGIGGSIYR